MRRDRNTFFQESQMNYGYMPNQMGMPYSQGNSSYYMGPEMPNNMNNMNNNLDSRLEKIERQIHRLESRVSKLESLSNNSYTTEEIEINNNSSMYMI